MKRFVLAAVLATLCLAAPAEARWGCGWGGWGGYRSYGWGGCGFGLSVGYCRPFYGAAYCGPGWCGPGWGGPYGYGVTGYGFGAPVGLGFYGYQPHGIYYNPGAGMLAYDLPTTSQPAELNYGPLAVKQFLGLPRDFAAAPPTPLAIGERPLARWSNAETRRKAERLLADGDALFRTQNFHAALQRYKLAGSTAPDVAEAFWRQGHALVATRNFDLASAAFKRALVLSPDVQRAGFSLGGLYAGAEMTKTTHLEHLAEYALARPADSDAYLLVGLFLRYDGQPDRAAKFLAKAAELSGDDAGYLVALLRPAAPPAAPVRAPAPAPAVPAEAAPSIPVAAGVEI